MKKMFCCIFFVFIFFFFIGCSKDILKEEAETAVFGFILTISGEDVEGVKEKLSNASIINEFRDEFVLDNYKKDGYWKVFINDTLEEESEMLFDVNTKTGEIEYVTVKNVRIPADKIIGRSQLYYFGCTGSDLSGCITEENCVSVGGVWQVPDNFCTKA